MTTSFWTANLERLRQSQPDLASHLAVLPLCNVRMLANAQGLMVGQTWDVAHQHWVALCDANDPVGEAERDADALWTRNAKIFCVFGLGLGYFPAALAKRLEPHQRMAIFDPSPMHYLAAMHAVDMTHLQSSERRVEIFVGDGLMPILENWWLGLQSHEKFHIGQPMRCGFTANCDAAAYDALVNKTGEMLRYQAVGLATWRQFGACIGDSDLGNLPEYLLTPGLDQMQGLWEGKPAVCVAAGPSLQKNLALLMEPALRDKVAVLTAGTVYAVLDKLGIQPDLVTTIDFQYLNWTDQFRRVPLDTAPPLVYLHSTHPSTVRRWPGARFVGLNASDTTAWMQQYAEPKPYAAQVQTVAHLNVVVAALLGANPIILLGQDLSMPPMSHHALGARAQDTTPHESYESHIEMPGFDGQPVWSRHSLLSMHTVFGQLIAAHPNRRFLNCTEGGLAIAGALNVSLATVLASLPAGDGTRLAPRLQAQARAYVPQPKLDAVQTDLARIDEGLVRLQDMARTVVRIAPTLNFASDTLRPEGAVDSETATDTQWEQALTSLDESHDTAASSPSLQEKVERTMGYIDLMACDSVLQQEGLAFGQIAVRCFEIIELMATIPPVSDTPEAELRRMNVERLTLVAQSILREAPHVRSVIRQTLRRLDDVALALKPNGQPPTTARLWQALARESCVSVAQVLRQWPQMESRLHVQLAWHQQRYQATQTLVETFQVAPHLAQKSGVALARYHAQTQPLVQPYVRAVGVQEPVSDAVSP